MAFVLSVKNVSKLSPAAADLLRMVHKTIKAVSKDLAPEEYTFNTAIARCIELTNSLYKFTGGKTSFDSTEKQLLCFAVKNLLLLLAPMAPHITEEIWHLLEFAKNKEESIHIHNWPEYEESLTIDDEIELVLQINGKTVNKLTVKRGLAKAESESLALSDNKMSAKLDARPVKKIIVVQNKLVNVVIDL
jgi:leucyl-tRNA synthetase